MNQAVFRQWARTLPLKDSAKAFSLGLPGRLKSRVSAPLMGPQIQITEDKIRGVVDALGLWIACHLAGPIEACDNVHGLLGEAWVQGRREPAEGVDDRQNADLAPVEQLIVQKVHGSDTVGPEGPLAVLTQLRLDLALGHAVAKLQSQRIVEPIHFLAIDRPSLAFEQQRDPPEAIAHPGLGNLLEALLPGYRIGPVRLAVMLESFRLEFTAGGPDADLPSRSQLVHEMALPGRSLSFGFPALRVA